MISDSKHSADEYCRAEESMSSEQSCVMPQISGWAGGEPSPCQLQGTLDIKTKIPYAVLAMMQRRRCVWRLRAFFALSLPAFWRRGLFWIQKPQERQRLRRSSAFLSRRLAPASARKSPVSIRRTVSARLDHVICQRRICGRR